MTDTTTQTWLTQEAHDRLVNELEHLTGPGRAEIVQRIESAREEGDLRENGGYHAAKEEQGKQELRIRQLQGCSAPRRSARRRPRTAWCAGSVVTVRFPGDDDTMTFLLGSRRPATSTSRCTRRSRRWAAVAGKMSATRPPTRCLTAARPPSRSSPPRHTGTAKHRNMGSDRHPIRIQQRISRAPERFRERCSIPGPPYG